MNTATLNRPAIEPTTALTEQASTEVGALALIKLDPARYVAEVFKPFHTKLSTLIAAADAAEFDIKTTAGMAIAVKHRAAFRDEVRIAGENARVERKAPLLSIGKLLDSEYKTLAAAALPHEEKFDKVIKAEESRKEAEKAAKIKAERERMDAIQARIAKIIAIPADVAGMQSSCISDEFDALTDLEIDDSFDTFRAAAETAKTDTLAKLQGMIDKAKASEQAAHEAEQARIAEIARVEQERQELAKLRIESERIANEQAAERQRLADLAAAQELAAKQLRDKAEANLKAERDAQAEQMRIERERVAAEQAKAAAEIKAQQDRLAEQQAAADARDAAALAAQQDAQRRDDDHGPALEMNAMFDAAAVACARFPEVLAEQVAEEAEINADLARCTETANAMLTNGRSLVQPESYSERDAMIDAADGMDIGPTDTEIIDVYVENFGGTRAQAVARLLAFVGDVADVEVA